MLSSFTVISNQINYLPSKINKGKWGLQPGKEEG